MLLHSLQLLTDGSFDVLMHLSLDGLKTSGHNLRREISTTVFRMFWYSNYFVS
jgi:phosphotransferase system IIA component